jgi:hypothetical protein
LVTLAALGCTAPNAPTTDPVEKQLVMIKDSAVARREKPRDCKAVWVDHYYTWYLARRGGYWQCQ